MSLGEKIRKKKQECVPPRCERVASSIGLPGTKGGIRRVRIHVWKDLVVRSRPARNRKREATADQEKENVAGILPRKAGPASSEAAGCEERELRSTEKGKGLPPLRNRPFRGCPKKKGVFRTDAKEKSATSQAVKRKNQSEPLLSRRWQGEGESAECRNGKEQGFCCGNSTTLSNDCEGPSRGEERGEGSEGKSHYLLVILKREVLCHWLLGEKRD